MPPFGLGTAVPTAVPRARVHRTTRTRGAGGRGLLGAGRKAKGKQAANEAALLCSADSGEDQTPSDSNSPPERRIGKEIDDELLLLKLLDIAEGSGPEEELEKLPPRPATLALAASAAAVDPA